MTKPNLSYKSIVSIEEQIDGIIKEFESIGFEPEGFPSFLMKQLRFSFKFGGKRRRKVKTPPRKRGRRIIGVRSPFESYG